MEEILKRKREDSEERRKREGEETFRDSKKISRTPEKGVRREEKGIGEMMGRWREEMEKIVREMKGVKGWREEFK